MDLNCWARQELECIRFELNRINSKWGWGDNFPHHFLGNQIAEINQIQEALLRGNLEEKERHTLWHLAATLYWHDQPWCTLQGKMTIVAAQAANVCRRLGGIKAPYMSNMGWEIYPDEVVVDDVRRTNSLRLVPGCLYK